MLEARDEIRCYYLRRRAAARGRRGGARGEQDHFQDHDQFRHGDAGWRLSALWQRLRRGDERGRRDAVDRAAQHQGLQREHSVHI